MNYVDAEIHGPPPYPHTRATKMFLNITLQKTGDVMDIAGEAKVYANFQEENPR